MNRGSTLFLKLVVVGLGLAALAFLLIPLPNAIRMELQGDFDYTPLLMGLYLPAIPFFIALMQAFKLLTYIDKNQAFSEVSVTALKKIMYCGLSISGIFAAGMPYIFFLADRDDAPGLALMGFVIIGASFVIGIFAALLQKLLKNAIDIKSENELTV